MTNENIIQTPYGIFQGIDRVSYYSSGIVSEVTLNEKNMVVTHAGELVPYYTTDHRRKYKSSVSFHPNGMIKSISLEEQQEVVTPIGDFPAEMVTFYNTGELKRIFILNGKISGFWSEDNERELNIPLSFKFDFANFTSMLVGICFYISGNIKSITLFPKEEIDVQTDLYGTFRVKTGFSLYENGRLKSFEPASPREIKTPIGNISAFDISATGINADTNSVVLNEDGRLRSVMTSSDKISVLQPNGVMKFIVPLEKQNPLDENEVVIIPIKLEFDYVNDNVKITDEQTYEFSISECTFNIYKGTLTTCSPENCANCSLCS